MLIKLKFPISRAQFLTDSRAILRHQMRQLTKKDYSIRFPRKVDVMRLGPKLHLHPQPELSFQLSGSSSMLFLHQTMVLGPGEVLLIPRGMAHHESVLRPRERFLNLVIKFEKSDAHFHFARCRGEVWPTIEAAEIFKTSSLRLAQLFEDASDALVGKGSESKEIARGLLLAGFAGLLEILESKPTEKLQENARLSQCRMLVAFRFADPAMSVGMLSKELNCSASHLSRLFHAETGGTLTHYITEARLNNAKNLLQESTLSIKEIAWACGFKDPGYFIRVFRVNMGVTPLEYKMEISH